MAGSPIVFGLQAEQLARLSAAVPAVHRWYHENARDLPWRASRDPYAIWISEVMLQQTQVATVVPYYRRWLRAFPTVQALASSQEADVLRLWEGLGYYSRARNLHRAAREIVARHGGVVPEATSEFSALPGVGEYTTAAVLSIAFGKPLAAVDGNVKRVLSRLVALDAVPNKSAILRELRELATQLMDGHSPACHNQAMMELGATLCRPRQADCARCPFGGAEDAEVACRAAALGQPTKYPRRNARRPVPHRHYAVAVVEDARGRLLLLQRPDGGLLAGLWDFPAVPTQSDDLAESDLLQMLQRDHGLQVRVVKDQRIVEHAYTHFRVSLRPFRCQLLGQVSRASEAGPARRWLGAEALAEHALPRTARMILAEPVKS